MARALAITFHISNDNDSEDDDGDDDNHLQLVGAKLRAHGLLESHGHPADGVVVGSALECFECPSTHRNSDFIVPTWSAGKTALLILVSRSYMTSFPVLGSVLFLPRR